MTPIQVMLLFFLQQNNGLSLTQISQGLMLENPTVTGLIDRLEKSGYVKRSDHPSDRRVYLVHLTEKGNKVAKKALPIVKKLNEQIKEGYSKRKSGISRKYCSGHLTNSSEKYWGENGGKEWTL